MRRPRPRGDGVEGEEAADGEQQDASTRPAAGQHGARNGGSHGAERIESDELAGQRIADAEAPAHLGQESGRQGFNEDGDEAERGQRQQAGDGEAGTRH
jgi:hypothetical protein